MSLSGLRGWPGRPQFLPRREASAGPAASRADTGERAHRVLHGRRDRRARRMGVWHLPGSCAFGGPWSWRAARSVAVQRSHCRRESWRPAHAGQCPDRSFVVQRQEKQRGACVFRVHARCAIAAAGRNARTGRSAPEPVTLIAVSRQTPDRDHNRAVHRGRACGRRHPLRQPRSGRAAVRNCPYPGHSADEAVRIGLDWAEQTTRRRGRSASYW